MRISNRYLEALHRSLVVSPRSALAKPLGHIIQNIDVKSNGMRQELYPASMKIRINDGFIFVGSFYLLI